MKVVINKTLTSKLEDLEAIGNNAEEVGGIFGVKENDELVPLSQEIYELVAFDLMDKKSKALECFGRKFKITIEEK